MAQSHGASIHREPAGSGGVPTSYLVQLAAGPGGWGLTLSLTGPAAAVLGAGVGGGLVVAPSSVASAARAIMVRQQITIY